MAEQPSSQDNPIIDMFPRPVALAYKALLNAKTSQDRARLIFDIYDFSIRMITLGLTLRYLRLDLQRINSTPVNEKLSKHLVSSYVGNWVDILRMLLDTYAEHQTPFFVNELYDDYRALVNDEQKRAAFWQPFEELARLSNDFKGLATRRATDAQFAPIAQQAQETLGKIIQRFHFFASYKLILVLMNEEAEAMDCTGDKLVPRTLVELGLADTKLQQGIFYLVRQSDHAALELHPLIIVSDPDKMPLDVIKQIQMPQNVWLENALAIWSYRPEQDTHYFNALMRSGMVVEDTRLIGLLDDLYSQLMKRLHHIDVAETLNWKILKAAFDRLSSDNAQEIRSLYNQQVYLKREKVNDAINEFLWDSTSSGLVITGDSGVGKSAFSLWQLEQASAAPNLTMLWYSGRNFPPNRAIIEKMTADLSERITAKISPEDNLFDQLNTQPDMQQQRVLVFFDALNENSAPVAVLNAIDELVRQAEQYPWLKIIITSRPQAWRTIRSGRVDKTIERLYYTHPGSNSPTLELEGFQSGEIEMKVFDFQSELHRVYELYRKEYNLQTAFDKIEFKMAELLRDPFALQMIARIYQGRTLPASVNPIDLVEMLVTRLREESAENLHLEAADLDFLNELLPLFFDNENNPRNFIPRKALENLDPEFFGHSLHDRIMNDTPDSQGQMVNAAYQRLENAGILTLEGTRAEYVVRFRFERFYDYFVGNHLYLHIGNKPLQDRFDNYLKLVDQMRASPFLWGPLHRAMLLDIQQHPTLDLVLKLAPETEKETLNAPVIQDLLTEALVAVGSKDAELVSRICNGLLYSRYDSTYSRIRNWPHGYVFAITVANALQLLDVLKAATTHPDEIIRNAVLYSAYVSYGTNPEITMEIVRHVIGKIWQRRFLVNFSAIYTAFTLSMLLFMSYYSTPEGPAQRKELVALWMPVLNRLPKGGGKRSVWSAIRGLVIRVLFTLVIRIVVYRIGYSTDNKALFAVPDGEAALPIDPRVMPDLEIFLKHYRGAMDKERMHEIHFDEIRPRWEAVLLHPDGNIRNNIMVSIIFFASMLPWARRDPVAMNQAAREMFDKAKSLRDGIMKKPTPMVNVLAFIFGNMEKPTTPEGVEKLLENFDTVIYEFEEVWESRTHGLKASYRGDNMGTCLSIHYNFTGSMETPYLARYLDLLVERKDVIQFNNILSGMGGSGGLVDMEVFPNRSPYVLQRYLNEIFHALPRLKSQGVDMAIFSDKIVTAMVHQKQLDPVGAISLLEEQSDDELFTDLMKQRILTTRRSPSISFILVTVVSWFATAAAYAEDPAGREVFFHLLHHIATGKNISNGLLGFINHYLGSSEK